MIELNSPVWLTLDSASGGVGSLLDRLLRKEGDFRENMEALSEELGHRLSYYSATAYALPHLAALCAGLPEEDQIFLIAQIGPAVAAEADQPLEPASAAFQEFQQGLEGLGPLTKRLAASPEAARLLAEDVELGQQFALAALSIVGDRRHAYGLYLLSSSCWEEGAVACECGWEEETLPLAERPDCLIPASTGPWDGQFTGQEAAWLQGLLALAGDDQISSALPLVYGMGVCPDCGKREPFWNWLYRFLEDC